MECQHGCANLRGAHVFANHNITIVDLVPLQDRFDSLAIDFREFNGGIDLGGKLICEHVCLKDGDAP